MGGSRVIVKAENDYGDLNLWENCFSPANVYPPGTIIFQQGAQAQDVFLIGDGLVKLVRNEENGTEIIVGLRSSGDLLGAVSVLINRPQVIAAVTVSQCNMQRLPGYTFLQILEDDVCSTLALCRMIGHEIVEHITHLSELACLSARSRLELFLWESASVQGKTIASGRVRLRLPLKEYDVAKFLSVTPVHLSRLLSEVERDGIIIRDKGWLLIDKRRLKHHCTELLEGKG